MLSNLLGTAPEEVVSTVLDEGADVLYVVNPSSGTLDALIEVAASSDADLPDIRVLAEKRVLKDVTDDFIVASNAADLVDREVLSLRIADELPRNSLLVTERRVVALVAAGERVGGLVTDDETFLEETVTAYRSAWDDATAFTIRTPGISRVRTSLSETIDERTATDFDQVLASLETARGDGDGLDEVTISLLVAAKNDVLLYDISKWGEDVGIASKATFSRTKTRLEDVGLIDTEKVPIDVGRPRLRLKLADDRLRDAAPGELASVAGSVLAS